MLLITFVTNAFFTIDRPRTNTCGFVEACEQPVLPSKSMVVGRPTTDKRCIFDTKGGMDHHEHARLAAIVSRRRKQLSSLEQQVIDVRRQLEEDEKELARLRSYHA